ncbi:MAG: hypothetical protein Q9184_007261 [Pyrenodesmia sp. 2 TL-2023]
MDSLTTHPSTAQQATAFTSPASLSFPGGAGDLTPPSEKDGHSQANGISGQTNGINGQVHGGTATSNGNGVTPSTPAATPGAGTGVSGIVPTLQNIVATVNLDCRLDLKTIALHARNAEYNPKRFAAVIMRIREPKTTALIFASGKMVVTGAKSEDDSKLASRKYARIIQKLGFNAKFTDFKIQNIVGSCDIKFPIRLEGLASRHHNFSSYEPELFPGLIYRMIKPKIVLLIFVSGKIVLTGAKVREEIYQAFEMIYPVLSVSTTLAILESPIYSQTHVTLVDPNLPDTTNREHGHEISYDPSAHASSIDSSRIIRPDYASPAYSRLAAEAQEAWRQGFGGADIYHESGLVVVAGREGSPYVEAACRNVEDDSNSRQIESLAPKRRKGVERLSSPAEIRAIAGLPPFENTAATDGEDEKEDQLGSTGYINHTSGWANAEGAMRTVMLRLLSHSSNSSSSSRLILKRAHVKSLLFTPVQPSTPTQNQDHKPTVTGVTLTDSTRLNASLTILATGAWTSSLLDLRGHIRATAQEIAYLPLTTAEAHSLRNLPVLLNLSTGYFVIPPAKNASCPASTSLTLSSPSAQPSLQRKTGADNSESTNDQEEEQYPYHLKLARHSHGYTNPTTTPYPSPTHPSTPSTYTPSLPTSPSSPLPSPALHALHRFQKSLFPSPTHPLHSRPFSHTRLCWYTDTPTGDFLITYHPAFEGLFLCTGASGHGFKFLPVLGRRVVDVLRGQGGEWERGWGWREGVGEGEWVGDGSRGGRKGQVLGREGEREREREDGGSSKL